MFLFCTTLWIHYVILMSLRVTQLFSHTQHPLYTQSHMCLTLKDTSVLITFKQQDFWHHHTMIPEMTYKAVKEIAAISGH